MQSEIPQQIKNILTRSDHPAGSTAAERIFSTYVQGNDDEYTTVLNALDVSDLRVAVTNLLDYIILPIMEGERPLIGQEASK